jgi:hypothetical protein
MNGADIMGLERSPVLLVTILHVLPDKGFSMRMRFAQQEAPRAGQLSASYQRAD